MGHDRVAASIDVHLRADHPNLSEPRWQRVRAKELKTGPVAIRLCPFTQAWLAGIGCLTVESGGFSQHELTEAALRHVYRDFGGWSIRSTQDLSRSSAATLPTARFDANPCWEVHLHGSLVGSFACAHPLRRRLCRSCSVDRRGGVCGRVVDRICPRSRRRRRPPPFLPMVGKFDEVGSFVGSPRLVVTGKRHIIGPIGHCANGRLIHADSH